MNIKRFQNVKDIDMQSALAALIISTLVSTSSGVEMKSYIADVVPLEECEVRAELHNPARIRATATYKGIVVDSWASCQIIDPTVYATMFSESITAAASR